MKIISVIPTYMAASTIKEVATGALQFSAEVIVVDDACPEDSGSLVDNLSERITVIRRRTNGGVGAATKTGFLEALSLGADIIVKMDSDGQMKPELIPYLVSPLIHGSADYSKGTRFDSPEDLEGMPVTRLIGNSGLTLINKFTSGYWSVNDPTNGFIAMTAKVAQRLSWGKIADGYFFESDLLFRLRLIGAKVTQMSMSAVYKSETSGLKPIRIFFPFIWGHIRNFTKRIFYLYFIREWSIGTIYLIASAASLAIGVFASFSALLQAETGNVGTGTAVLSSLGLILWVQLLTQFLSVDVTSEPK